MGSERRQAVTGIGYDLLARLLDLPEGVSIRHLYADPLRSGVTVILEGDRFEPVPDGAEAPHLRGGRIDLRLMPAPAFKEGDSGPAPGPDDVLYARFVLDLPEKEKP